MRQIIAGKAYDTDKADQIYFCSNGYSRTDFKYVEETLYRTRKGRWFLYGRGGPLTRYAESCGDNSYTGGSRIEPLSENEARDWLMSHAPAEVFEQHFAAEEA